VQKQLPKKTSTAGLCDYNILASKYVALTCKIISVKNFYEFLFFVEIFELKT
jgi:hypothetical protein